MYYFVVCCVACVGGGVLSIISGSVKVFPVILLFDSSYRCPWHQYVTRSRKSYFDCELDISADCAKSAVHACEKCLTLASYVPKLQSFKFHTRAYLGFEISPFISVL